MTNETENQLAVSPTEERNIEIIPFGTDEKIKLNVGMVQKMIAVPTKNGHIPNAVQCMKFLMLCKSRHLNPWEGDAYLIGYDTHTGPQFSLITAHQVFLKRAEASESFDGMESGVVIEFDGQIDEREGDLTYKDETVLGGWAKVYRKDIGRPIYKRIKLSTFNTGRSRWEKDPAGMIVKCAEADALRTAFPTHLGGLYLKEEAEPIDVTPRVKDAPKDIRFEEPETIATEAVVDPETGKYREGLGEVTREPNQPKRKRRTKAEMEADRLRSMSQYAPEEEEPETRTEGVKVETTTTPDGDVVNFIKDDAPPRATPLEGLRNLIKASPITEFQLEQRLIRKGILEPTRNLESLSDEKLLEIQMMFMALAAEIVDAP